MNEEHADFAERLWYSHAPLARAARAALAPASLLFAGAAGLRDAAWRLGLARPERAPAPVVSVGSLRVGGAGKTPFVAWLVAALHARSLAPCIVTRGYASDASSAQPFVLDRQSACAPQAAARAGDEATMLALRTGVPVAVGSNRLAACRLAARSFPLDVFVLDDGFQHRALARDIDIVLVTGNEASERLLPAGPLRESVAALARASVVIQVEDGSGPRGQATTAARARARTRPVSLVSDVAAPGGDDVSSLRGRRVVAVAAIARPARFLACLRTSGAEIVHTVLRRDHYRFGDADRREIEEASAGADLVVTTEKDLVKLGAPPGGEGPTRGARPLVALRIAMELDEENALVDRIVETIAAAGRGA
ncbi:MAG TPA: tetraacyldisaccharide 4'-kinase [Candidatus Binatia bacterium]|jgi:tetraacyldisaccharide 4'-kinase